MMDGLEQKETKNGTQGDSKINEGNVLGQQRKLFLLQSISFLFLIFNIIILHFMIVDLSMYINKKNQTAYGTHYGNYRGVFVLLGLPLFTVISILGHLLLSSSSIQENSLASRRIALIHRFMWMGGLFNIFVWFLYALFDM